MLFIVSTPIGNLKDISQRAIEALQECDYILCEDTRHSLHLFQKLNIHKPLFSYHEHNESRRTESVVSDLSAGKNIGLVCDAGTPGISDPGRTLVKKCYELGIQVVPLPGPCAAIAALSASPLPTDRFEFLGFLPRGGTALKSALTDALNYPGTSVCYESPFRIVETLATLKELSPEAPVCVCRELTKIHEEFRYGSAEDVHLHYSTHPPKGEIVLLIGHSPPINEEAAELSKQEALKSAAKLLGISRKELYALLNKK